MTVRFMTAFWAVCLALFWAGGAAAQSTPDRIVYGPCTRTDIDMDIHAQYAAAVGVMSTDRDMRGRLLGSDPGRRTAALCTFQVSEAFCNREFLEFTAEALTTSMTAGGAGRYFFEALGAADAAEDPAGNALGMTMGLGGAILGGIMGSGDGLGGIAKGGATGGLLGFGAGTYWSSKMALDRCTDLQARFTDLTQRLVSAGLAPQRHHRDLFREIRRISERWPAEDRAISEAMIEAMAVSAAKIDSIR